MMARSCTEAITRATGRLATLIWIAAALVTVSGDEIRCYCNEANCVSTGYMCKSSRFGVCFSQLTRDGLTVRSVHGCAESLPTSDYGACAEGVRDTRRRRLGGSGSGRQSRSTSPVLLCCRQDMCNYMHSVYFSGRKNDTPPSTKNEMSESSSRSLAVDESHHRGGPVAGGRDDDETSLSRHTSRAGRSTERLWLRVAIIAVPVAGVCILVPLVIVAVRLLTYDRQKRHRTLSASHVTSAGSSAPPLCASPYDAAGTKVFRSWSTPTGRKCLCSDVVDLGSQRQDTYSPRRLVLAAVHSSSSRKHGYQQMRTSSLPCNFCKANARHSLDGTACNKHCSLGGEFV